MVTFFADKIFLYILTNYLLNFIKKIKTVTEKVKCMSSPLVKEYLFPVSSSRSRASDITFKGNTLDRKRLKFYQEKLTFMATGTRQRISTRPFKPFIFWRNTVNSLHLLGRHMDVCSPACSPKIRGSRDSCSYLIGPCEVDEALQNGWAQPVHHVDG